jgi:hypothetical protein
MGEGDENHGPNMGHPSGGSRESRPVDYDAVRATPGRPALRPHARSGRPEGPERLELTMCPDLSTQSLQEALLFAVAHGWRPAPRTEQDEDFHTAPTWVPPTEAEELQ